MSTEVMKYANGKEYRYSESAKKEQVALCGLGYIPTASPEIVYDDLAPHKGRYKKETEVLLKDVLFKIKEKKSTLNIFNKLEILAGSGIIFSVLAQMLFQANPMLKGLLSTIPVGVIAIVIFAGKFFNEARRNLIR